MSSLLVFYRVYRLEMQLVMWGFRTSIVNYCLFLSGSPPPPLPPSGCQSTEYTDSVWLGGGGGFELCW
jgi:hypothetical protein